MCHVLIIEDEMLVALDLQSVLIDEGATSFAFAATESEAIEQACARKPYVMTSDVNLLTGSGPSAVQTIRERLGMIPVLFVSATPGECCPRDDRDSVFTKPFDRSGIARAFRAIVNDTGYWDQAPLQA